MAERTERGDLSGIGQGWFLLIVANVVVFTLWQFPGARDALTEHTVTSAGALGAGRVWTLVCAAVSHASFGHVAVNMVLLYVFGRELETVYERGNLVLLYGVGAVSAFLMHIALSTALGDPGTTMLGASGAVMAIAVVTVAFFPERQLDFGLFTVPLWLLVAAFVLLDLSGLLQASQGVRSGVAHGAHLGGAVAGAFFKAFDLRLFNPRSARAAVIGPDLITRLRSRFARTPTPEPTSVVDVDVELLNSHDELMPLSERVDEVLRKISSDGLESLTDEERALLDEASEMYRSEA